MTIRKFTLTTENDLAFQQKGDETLSGFGRDWFWTKEAEVGGHGKFKNRPD